jgi:hypothetical protein
MFQPLLTFQAPHQPVLHWLRSLLVLLMIVITAQTTTAASLTWSGFVSDEWTNPLNWVPNRVPTSADDVLIPGTYTPGNPLITSTFPGTTPTPNQPVVRVNGQAVNSISLNTVAVLTLNTNGSLNIATDIVNNGGTLNSRGGSLIVSGSLTTTNAAFNSTSGNVTVGGSFTNTASTVSSTGGNLIIGGSLTNTGGTITGNGGTFTVGGSFSNATAAATLMLNSGSTLNLGGNFTNSGGTVGGNGTGRLALTGNVVQSIGGTISTFPNLTVGTASATTMGPVSILSTGGVVLNGSLAIGTNQAFTLLSDANGTAYVVNNNSALATGRATVQRYIAPTLNAGPGYRHYSTPVGGNTVDDFRTTSYTPVVNSSYNISATPPSVTPFPNIFTYDQARLSLTNTSPEFDKGFQSPTALSDRLTPTSGYTVNIPASALVDFTGTLNSGNYARSGLRRGPQATAGWQLLGNPYPSAIDYDIVRANSSGIEAALYVFKSNGQYTGSYTSYVNGQSTNTATNVLPIAQGFFVRVAPGQMGSVTFTNSSRLNTASNTPFQRTAADTRPRLTLALGNTTLRTQTVVYFETGATAAFDPSFDAHYLPATNGLTLATETSTSELLSINGQSALTGAKVVLPLQLASQTAGSYVLAADELANLPTGYHAYLRDALTGSYTDLATTPSVNLTLAPTDAPTGRYALVFSTATPLATTSAALAQLASLYPNPAHGTTVLLLPTALRAGQAVPVEIVNALGQVIRRAAYPAATEELTLPLDGLAAGLYTVQAHTAAGTISRRLTVE